MEKGNPLLPKLEVSTIVPDDRDVSCEIADLNVVSFDVLPVIPSKGSLLKKVNPDTIPYTFNKIYYNGEWFPERLQEVRKPFFLCDYWGRTARLNVFRHNPTLGKLEVARQFEVRLTYRSGVFPYRHSISSSFLPIYQGFFLNFSPAHYGNNESRIKMTIITADQFYNDVLPLRNWKMKKGIVVEEIKRVPSELAADTTAIKEYISDQWWNHNVRFFLLVGDYEQIPSPLVDQFAPPWPERYPADPRYIMLYPDEEDPYPDAYISRISGNIREDIRNQIDKIVGYERFPPAADPPTVDWPNTALVIASHETISVNPPRPDTARKNRVADMLLRKCSEVIRLYDDDANPPNVSGVLNNGCGFVNYLGHGEWYRWFLERQTTHNVFTIEDVNALQNWGMPPFILSVACDVGRFDTIDACFAEAWLRKEPLAGAVGFYGSSAPQWADEPFLADSVAIQCLTYDWLVGQDFPNIIGEALYKGGVEMITHYPGFGYFTFVTWHIIGDANMQLRMGRQFPLNAVHSPQARPGQDFPVWVDFGPGIPCRRAVVCLWKEDDDYNEYQLTGLDGCAIFHLPDWLTPGQMFVTATKNNHASYEGTAQIGPPVAGGQAGPGDLGSILNLSVLPSVSGPAFTIRVPTYALNIEVYDVSGRLLSRFPPKRELFWKGTDQSGMPLPEGVYFIKASGKGKSEVKKVLLVK